MWPREMAADVVEALANNGYLVMALDLRTDDAGWVLDSNVATEILSQAFRPAGSAHSVDDARSFALDALSRPELAEMPECR